MKPSQVFMPRPLILPVAISLLGASCATAPGQALFDNDSGDLRLETAQNWSGDVLPTAPANAFIGASGGPGGTPFSTTLDTFIFFGRELQIGTEANPYGALPTIPGGGAIVTLNVDSVLTTPAANGNIVIGQGRDNLNNNSGQLVVTPGSTLDHGGDRIFIGFYDNDNIGATQGTLTVTGGVVNSLKPGNRMIIGGWDTGDANNFGRGFLQLNSGQINALDVIVAAGGGVGQVGQTDGMFNVNGFFTMSATGAIRNTTAGTYNLSGDMATSVLTVGADFTVHEAGATSAAVSVFNQSGGTVNLNASGINAIGRAGTDQGKGVYNLSGGAMNVNNADLVVGGINTGGRGELNISGSGILNVADFRSLAVGRSVNSIGTVTQSGGTVTLGAGGSGLALGAPGATATYNLNGGTLNLGGITPDSAAASTTLNLNGGVLRPNLDFTVQDTVVFTSQVFDGGAIFETNGFDIAWNANLAAGSASGGLTKAGAGTLTLNGTNTYTGTTEVAAGRLLVNGSISGSSVNVSGILGGGTALLPGIVGSVSVFQGGIIAPGDGMGSLTANGSAAFAAGSFLSLEINTSTLMSDLFGILGSLSLANTDETVLTIADLNPAPMTFGTLTLVTYGGPWDGDLFTYQGSIIPDGGQLTVGLNTFTLDYDLGGNSVALIAVPEPSAVLGVITGAFALVGLRRRRVQ